MQTPFQVHSDLTKQAQAFLGGGDRNAGAVLTVGGTAVPCTTSQVVTDFDLVPGGQSPKTFIEQVEFLASDFPANLVPKKGVNFSLKLNPNSPAIALKFWSGGLMPGGLAYRFMAVDVNYAA